MSKVLRKKLRTDKELYFAWQSNIAMCFYDAMRDSKKRCPAHKDLLKICNEAAVNFLELYIKE